MLHILRAGSVKQVRLAAVPHPEHIEAGLALDAHAVSEGDYYGVSRAEEIPSRSLTATDLDALELQPEQFRVHLRTRLGITNGGVRWDNGELLDLGFVEIGGHRIYVVYALRQPKPSIGDALRARANGAHPVLLLPTSEANGFELAHVILESALPTKQGFIRQAVVLVLSTARCRPSIQLQTAHGSLLILDSARCGSMGWKWRVYQVIPSRTNSCSSWPTTQRRYRATKSSVSFRLEGKSRTETQLQGKQRVTPSK